MPWIKLHRYLALGAVVLLVLHILEVGGFVGLERLRYALEVDETPIAESVLSKGDAVSGDMPALTDIADGTYMGEAMGFNPGLIVEVTVVDNRIENVEVLEHNEHGREYWGRPVAEIPVSIVAAQSTQVDVVSGATMTSNGIIKAVENALEAGIEAKVSSTVESDGHTRDGLNQPSKDVTSTMASTKEVSLVETETVMASSTTAEDALIALSTSTEPVATRTERVETNTCHNTDSDGQRHNNHIDSDHKEHTDISC